MNRMTNFLIVAAIAGVTLTESNAVAQRSLFRGSDPPGVLAHKRLIAEPGIANYDQPVRIIVPAGGQVSYWEQGFFSQPIVDHALLGMRVGPVYSLKVSAVLRGIPVDVYPTVEMLDRLYPPEGLSLQHPVKIVLNQDDIEDASQGSMITKVIYLEDPDTALPYRQPFDHQAAIDIGSGQDPFAVADRLGRPMAIIRIGSRQPLANDNSDKLQHQLSPVLFECPPLVAPAPIPSTTSMKKSAVVQTTGVQELLFDTCHPETCPPALPDCNMDDDNTPLPDCPPIPADICELLPLNSQLSTLNTSLSTLDSQLSTLDSQLSTLDSPLPPICQPPFRCCAAEVARLPKPRRDEYVCDGNDRDPAVVAKADWKLLGLDVEDTIAHYDTLSGKILVTPSNRVCIYSPRFASVRRVLRANYETITQKLSVANDTTPIAAASGKDFSTTTLQNVQLRSNRKTERPNAFIDRTRGVTTGNVVKLLGTRHYFKPFEDLQLIRYGQYSAAESARLSMALQSAVAWESDVSAQITINKNQPIIVKDIQQARELVAIESDGSPNLRLCKLASRINAQSGETVDFTLRFDNIGRETIGNVTIVDNLSPRLEYVEGSAECSVEAEFKKETNESGSLTLRWEITDPLKVRTGGLIRFQCLVR